MTTTNLTRDITLWAWCQQYMAKVFTPEQREFLTQLSATQAQPIRNLGSNWASRGRGWQSTGKRLMARGGR
jgi:hypothetical protein